MITAKVTWTEQMRFAGSASSGHSVLIDGDSKVASSPMELVLVALCGCTGYDVVSILQKKREPLAGLVVSAEAEKAADSPRVYTSVKLIYRISGKVSRKAVED